MMSKLCLIVPALLAAGAAQAAPMASPAPTGASSPDIRQVQYAYPYHGDRYGRRYGYGYHRVNRQPWPWNYQQTFRSNSRDFYGSRNFQGD